MHVTVVLPVHEKAGVGPLVCIAEKNVALAGVASVTVTLTASLGPELDTDRMKETWSPDLTLLEPTPLIIERSAEGFAAETKNGADAKVEPLLEMTLTFQPPRLSTVVFPSIDV